MIVGEDTYMTFDRSIYTEYNIELDYVCWLPVLLWRVQLDSTQLVCRNGRKMHSYGVDHRPQL